MESKILDNNFGGEISEIIKKFVGKKAFCIKDKKEFIIYKLHGYKTDSGGLKDKKGNEWWVYWICPECQHEYSANKIILV